MHFYSFTALTGNPDRKIKPNLWLHGKLNSVLRPYRKLKTILELNRNLGTTYTGLYKSLQKTISEVGQGSLFNPLTPHDPMTLDP